MAVPHLRKTRHHRCCFRTRTGGISHGLEHVDSLLRVALANLLQGFVFIATLAHVLSVKNIVACRVRLHLGCGQVGTQRLWINKDTFNCYDQYFLTMKCQLMVLTNCQSSTCSRYPHCKNCVGGSGNSYSPHYRTLIYPLRCLMWPYGYL